MLGAAVEVVGLESGVVSGVFNLDHPALERPTGDHTVASGTTRCTRQSER